MGVEARVVLYSPSRALAEDAARLAFARIARLDSLLSDYRVDSEVSRLSGRPAGEWMRIGPDLFRLLEHSLELSRETKGAFDVTAGPVVERWREARRTGRLPDAMAVRDALARVGWHHVTLDTAQQAVRFAIEGIRLDFGAIAKGYAADQAWVALQSLGVERALIEIGGDIVAGRAPPGARGWRVRVPGEGRTRSVETAAVSTSGDAAQLVVIDGVRYSHVVDPRTGLGLTRGLTVTVIAADGLSADGWATAASVLDPESRAAFILARPGATFLMHDAGRTH